MRIDSYIQVNQLYNTNKAKNAPRANKAGGRDSLEISSFGSAYQVARQAVAQVPEVRADRVKEIQARLAAGTYQVSLEDVADKMAEELLS